MALHYIEFDTTQQALMADLRTQILASSDWSRLTADTVLVSTSASAAAAATVLTVPTPAANGLAVGMVIMIDDGALREYRTITAVSATTVTVAALSFAHASGAAIRSGAELYKATTTRGAPMVVDLTDAHPDLFRITMAFYRNHVGGVPIDKSGQRYLYWRNAGGATTHILHVTLSLGPDHFFLSIEGPRGGETGALSSTGSLRNYMFMSDLVPYDLADTDPVVVTGAASVASADGAVGNNSHLAFVSRNLAATGAWQPAKLLTLTFPTAGSGVAVNAQRNRSFDGKYVLAPYVVFADDSGMRGRLAGLLHAGFNQGDNFEVPAPPVGSKVQYLGAWYKILAVNRSGDAGRDCYGALGAASNSNVVVGQRSVCVAVPCLP